MTKPSSEFARSRMINRLLQIPLFDIRRGLLIIVSCAASALVMGAIRPSKHASPSLQPAAAPVELLHDTPASPEESTSAPQAANLIAMAPRQERVVWMVVTAYCGCPKCCGPHARGLTASGRSIAYNGGLFVAADTKLFKFGSKLSVPGYAGEQPVEVIDRGSAIKGYHIDVFFPTHEQARAWGKKWIPVTVVDQVH